MNQSGIHQILKQHVPREFDFIGIGQAKSGTTALWYYILQHPDVYAGPKSPVWKDPHSIRPWVGKHQITNVPWAGLEVKEPNFFNIDTSKFPDVAERFKIAKHQIWLEGVKLAPANQLLGEFTVHYMSNKVAMERIKVHSPNTKLIAILRDPVDRCYSHINWLNNFNTVEEWEKRIDEIIFKDHYFKHMTHPSKYAHQIKYCYELFDKEQIKFIKYEDFRDNNEKVVYDVLKFLGLDLSKYSFTAETLLPKKYISPMSESHKSIFYEVFKDEIKEIEDLLGWDCSDWYKY